MTLLYLFLEKTGLSLRKSRSRLRIQGIQFFYDEYEESGLWGKDLTEELPKRYESARYCVVFFSISYMKKMWAYFERQVIIAHFLKQRGKKYLLPVFLDGFNERIPGISDVIAYVSINSMTDFKKLKDLIIEVVREAQA